MKTPLNKTLCSFLIAININKFKKRFIYILYYNNTLKGVRKMSSIKKKIKNTLFDTKAENIYDSIVEDAKFVQENLSLFSKTNKEQLKILEDETSEGINTLNTLKKNRNRKSAQGKLTIQELQNVSVRTKRTITLLKSGNSHSESEYLQAISQVYNFIDKIRTTDTQVKTLPYPNAGITILGLIFIVIPFLNVLSIIIGGYLAFSNDRRCQVNGTLMIIATIIVLLVSLLL